MKETLKVGVAGVRGVVGDSFTPQLAAAFAQAFGTFIGHGLVVVGRDTRPSGLMIEHAVVAGLQSVGCKPLLAGVVPTPTLLMLTRLKGARGGIAITASHNPTEWNALKFVDGDGMFLTAVRAEELFDIYHQQDFPMVPESEIPSVVSEPYPAEEHFKSVTRYVHREAIRRRKFKVAVDCCNGVGALYSPMLLHNFLGCELVPIFDTPSGLFEREPEPLPPHLGRLCEAVVRERCDVGFAQDPDGDRLAIVSEKGEPLGEDMTLALVMAQVLDHHDRGPVVLNLTASKGVEDVARARGCAVIRCRVGETNVTEAMLKAAAVVGGEHTGGVIIPRIHPCRDSFAAMAVLLERMVMTGHTPSQLRDEVPRYHSVRLKVPVRSDQSPGILRLVRSAYAEFPQNQLDGVCVDLGESWIHVRRSNTEPVMRINVEARTQAQAEHLASQVRAKIQESLGGSPDRG